MGIIRCVFGILHCIDIPCIKNNWIRCVRFSNEWKKNNKMDETNRLNIIECSQEYYEDAVWKNQWIAQHQSEYLGIVDQRATTTSEVWTFMEENDFLWEKEIVLFAENGPDGICKVGDLLKYPQIRFLGLRFQR